MNINEKLPALREAMQQKGIDAWILPTSDPHQSEYMADHWKIRRWFTGFSGSAGVCVVTRQKAGLWTDSRYWLQAAQELEGSGIELFKLYAPGVIDYRAWIREELEEGATVGFDGTILSVKEVKHLKKVFAPKKIKLKFDEELVAPLWKDRPALPQNPAMLLDEIYAGESIEHKIKRVKEAIDEQQVDYLLVSALDEIAWLFNLRGSDIKYNPVVISYAFLSKDDVCLFINKNKLDEAAAAILEECRVKFLPYESIFEFLTLLPSDKLLLINPAQTSQRLADNVNCKLKEGKSIITEMKAIKNEVEQDGIRKAHIQDGAALCRWIRWIKEKAATCELDEFTAGEKLEYFRSFGKLYQGPSFAPIVGFRENGAIVHYSAQKESAKRIEAGGLLLVDSGGQYLNGTTDVTRTITLGNVTDEERYYFTLVLAGHIDLARAVFLKGVSGAMLDTYARTPLWKHKLNYGHGTGHGVGHFLCVHEGPQSISPLGKNPLLPGSVTSNEPGIYLEGRFGIRIENIIISQVLAKNEFGEFCHFETVTLCPIDRELINAELLNPEQINWLNVYHSKVYELLSPHLDDADNKWLRLQTLPL